MCVLLNGKQTKTKPKKLMQKYTHNLNIFVERVMSDLLKQDMLHLTEGMHTILFRIKIITIYTHICTNLKKIMNLNKLSSRSSFSDVFKKTFSCDVKCK